MIQLLRRHWWIVLPLILECAIFRAWLQPGDLLGGDWLRRNVPELLTYFPWPHVWNSAQQVGENTEVYMSSFPMFALMGALAKLGLSWALIERICYFWPYLILAVLGSYTLAYRLTRNGFASAMGAMYFSINAFTIQATERGAVPSIVAVALIPAAAYLYLRFLDRPTPRWGLAVGAIVTAVLIYDIRYVYITMILTGLLTLERVWRNRSLSWLLDARFGFAGILGTIVIFNLYWIVPQLLEAANPGAGYGSLEDYTFISGFMSPAHALSAFEVFYHWVADDEPFHKYPADPQFFLIPILAFVSFALTFRKRFTKTFAVVAFLGVMLSSGPVGNFEHVNVWIFTHIPGMTLFRDASKWMSATNLGYAMLLSLGAARLAALIRALQPRRFALSITALAVCVVLLHAAFMSDSFNPIRFRLFATYNRAHDTEALERFIGSQPHYARTLVFPRDLESMRATPANPYIEAQPMLSYPKTDGIRHFNFDFSATPRSLVNPLLPNLWREMNVKYIVVPYDDDRIIYKPQMAGIEFGDAIRLLQSQSWAVFDRKIGRHYVFRIKNPMLDRGFMAPYPFIFNGSAQSLVAMSASPFWNAHAAAVFGDQPLTDDLVHYFSNYVSGVPIEDENVVSGQTEIEANFREAANLENLAAKPGARFIGAALSAPAASEHLYETALGTLILGQLNGRWPQRTPAQTQFLQTYQNSKINAFWSPSSTRLTQLAFAPRLMTFDTTAPVVLRPFTIAAVHKTKPFKGWITSNNPCTIKATAIISHVRLKNLTSATIRISLGNGTTTANLPLQPALGQASDQIVLRNLILPPGKNAYTVELLDDRPVKSRSLRAGAVVLPSTVSLALQDDPKCLESFASVGVSPLGKGIRMSAAEQRRPIKATAISIYRNLNIPVADYPAVSLWLGAADVNGVNPEVAFELTRASDGSHLQLMAPLDTSIENNTYYIRGLMNIALDDTFGRDLNFHKQDRRWLFENRLSHEPDGASGYNLTGAKVIFPFNGERSVKASVELRRSRIFTGQNYYGLSKGDRLADVTEGSLGPLTAVRETGFKVLNVARHGAVITGSFVATPIVFARDRRISMTFRLPSNLVAVGFLNFAMVAPTGFDTAFTWSNGKDSATNFTAPGSNEMAAEFPAEWQTNLLDSKNFYLLGVPRCLPVPCALPYTPAPAPEWRRYRINWASIESKLPNILSPLPNTLTITFFPRASGFNLLPKVEVVTGPTTFDQVRAAHRIDALTVDGNPISATSFAIAPESETVVADGAAFVDPKIVNHYISSAPSYPFRPLSVFLHRGTPKLFQTSTLRNVHDVTSTEISGDLQTTGGLFVLTQSYDPGWRAIRLPANASPSGSALLDMLRFGAANIAESRHLMVNDLFNGWVLGPGHYHFLFLFLPQAYVELGILLGLSTSIFWLIILLRFGASRK